MFMTGKSKAQYKQYANKHYACILLKNDQMIWKSTDTAGNDSLIDHIQLFMLCVPFCNILFINYAFY